MSVEASNRVKSQKEVATFLANNFPKYVAYVSSDGKYLTTWMGDELAKITRATVSRRRGFYGVPVSLYHVRATDSLGRHWSGSGAGRGMFIRIRRVK